MNKKLIVMAAAGVILAGCSLPTQLKKGASSEEAGESAMTESGETGEGQPFSGPLAAAVALGVPMKCTYTVNGVETTGYIKGKQFRGMMDVQGKQGNVIMKDNCMWTWSEGEADGVKMCYEGDQAQQLWDNPEAAAENPEPNATPEEAMSPAPQIEYNCLPTAIGDDEFTPPADVNFVDLGEMMKGINLPAGMKDKLPAGVEDQVPAMGGN